MSDTSLLSKAFSFAEQAHQNQVRKVSGTPYLSHLLDVASHLIQENASEHLIAAALLHDTLEDTLTTKEQLESEFGTIITDLVLFCTESGNEHDTNREEMEKTWRERKQQSINKCKNASKEQLMLMLADKLANLKSLQEELLLYGDEHVWPQFNSSKEGYVWQYEELLKVFLPLKDTRMYCLFEDNMKKIKK